LALLPRLLLLARSKCLPALLAWITWWLRVVVVVEVGTAAVVVLVGSVLAQAWL
jgi:hypothetical protein